MHKSGHSERKKRILSALLSVVMVWSLLPPMTLPARAAGETFTFSSGAVLLDSSFDGDNVIIQNGVFSVTVNGATNVNIIFEDVYIDRRTASDSASGSEVVMSNPPAGYTYTTLRSVSQALGWSGNNKAPVCPFMVMGDSTVTASFRGDCTFYAGTNASTVNDSNTYTSVNTGSGYAGIQVESGSTLTIEYAENLKVYGAHQLDTPDENGYINGGKTKYTDALRANADIEAAGYLNPYKTTILWWERDNTTYVPTGATVDTKSGGAGIGGGAAWNTSSSASTGYTAGTPGTIIINGGNIEAFGGHQAAGIGGGVNGAATTDKIVVNGGTVTAHGGRWAAGIGDGDSVAGTNKRANSLSSKRYIEINGGSVTSYGGVAAPGIGCSDEISHSNGFGTSAVSNMEIALNGGTIHAFSGFPDGFDGSYDDNVAPAAIGAGADSNSAGNSLFVSDEVDLACAGFGRYALTELGTNTTTVPTINIDPEAYLLLLRTEDYYSTDTRTLSLYYPLITQHPETGRDCYIYEDQNTHTIYYVDAEEELVYDANFDWVENTNNLKLTLHVDKEQSVKIQDIDLAYFFRSIALTLPDPAIYGGLYALTVPTDGIETDVDIPPEGDIVLTIEAHEQGTQSGYVEYPSQHNMGKDATSAPLTDLDINGDATTDGLIGDDFLPAVYAYTVYVEPNATEAELYFAFENGDATYKVKVNNTSVTMTEGTDPDTGKSIYYHKTAVPLSETETIVRVQKQDNAIGAISYKVTIIKKGDFALELSDPSKTYDGAPAKAVVESVDTGTEAMVPEDDLEKVVLTYYAQSGTDSNGDPLFESPGATTAPTQAGVYKVVGELYMPTYNATGSRIFTISKRPVTVLQVENWLKYMTSAEVAAFKASGKDTMDIVPGKILLDDVVSGDDVTASAASVYYNDLIANLVTFAADKITLVGVTLSGAQANNYTTEEDQTVFGQISYDMQGSIFRKTETGNWRKYYPVDSLDPVNSSTADYHSPATDGLYISHAEYVKARTVNDGTKAPRYAVDIEYGPMQFNFYRSIWNVNTLEYDELAESAWAGMDGTNNKLVVTNYSNRSVWYQMNAEIDFIYADISHSGKGISAKITADSAGTNEVASTVWSVIAPATAGDRTSPGTATPSTRYLMVGGIPQMDSDTYIPVGSITVIVSPTDPNSA